MKPTNQDKPEIKGFWDWVRWYCQPNQMAMDESKDGTTFITYKTFKGELIVLKTERIPNLEEL